MDWISVNDRLPELKDGVISDKVLIALGVIDKKICFGWCRAKDYLSGEYRTHEWVTPDMDPFAKQELITHWMPLPEPPKEENDGGEA